MKKPDLRQVSASSDWLFACLCLERQKRDGALEESRHFAHCGEILRYELGREITSRYVGWIGPMAALSCPHMLSHVC